MRKILSILFFAGVASVLVPGTSAQEKKPVEPPKPAQRPCQELLWMWNNLGNKLIAMADDFPEEKYNFKAQKDERTFGENLLHVASDYYGMISVVQGSKAGPSVAEDSLRKIYTTKADISKLLRQAVADGAQLIEQQGDTGLTREFKSPWGNFMFHGSIGWAAAIEHAGEHFGQLVVYYRVNGMVPPESRSRNK